MTIPSAVFFNGLLLLVLSIVVVAQSAHAGEQPSVYQLQRLFTTPLERAQLDARRRRGVSPGEQEQPSSQTTAALPPLQVEVKGVMKRKNAPDVVWVNQGNTLNSRTIDDRVRVSNPVVTRSGKVPLRVNDRTVRLKPGQVWNEFEDTISDKYAMKPEALVTETAQKVLDADETTDKSDAQ